MKYLPLLFVIASQFVFGQLTLEDIWIDYKFYPKKVSPPQWNSPSSYVELQYKGSLSPRLVQISVDDNRSEEVLMTQKTYEDYIKKVVTKNKQADLSQYVVNDFIFSPNGTHILLIVGRESRYRYSSKSNLLLYDINTKTLSNIF